MNDETESEPSQLPEPRKKPYQPPSLVRLGALRDLTLKVGWRGRRDGRAHYPHAYRTSW